MKIALRIVLVLLAVIVIAVVGVWFYLDSIAASAIARGGTYATGVPTAVDSARLAPFQGELHLDNLVVANPEGYQTDHFLKMDDGEVAVDLGTLTSDLVRIPRVHLSGLDLNLENRDGKANYEVIMENLQRLSAEEDPAAAPGKQYIIDEVLVSDITVHAAMLPSMGEPRVLKVKVPSILLTEVGSEGADGAQMAEVTGVILKAVLQAVIEQAGEVLPAAIASGLRDGLAGIGSLGGGSLEKIGGEAAKVVSDLTGSEEVGEALRGITGGAGGALQQGTGKLGEELGKGVEGAGDAVNESAKGVGEEAGKAIEGLENLLGGKKQQPRQETEQEPAQ